MIEQVLTSDVDIENIKKELNALRKECEILREQNRNLKLEQIQMTKQEFNNIMGIRLPRLVEQIQDDMQREELYYGKLDKIDRP
jgi:hypothetical protein